MELRSLLSGTDALTILEIVHGSLNCTLEKNFVDLFSKLQTLFSFDFACAILGCRKNKRIVAVDRINISYPEEFNKIYKERNYIQIDAIVKENFKNYQLQYWSVKKRRPFQSKELVSFAADFGNKSGYTHGLRPFGFQKYGSLFCFSGASVKADARTDAILEVIIPHLHLSLSQIRPRKKSENHDIVLSRREKEVLEWVKQGKSSWDISVILNISESTVNFHIYNIMGKLGAVNRSQMVAVATRLDLIDIN